MAPVLPVDAAHGVVQLRQLLACMCVMMSGGGSGVWLEFGVEVSDPGDFRVGGVNVVQLRRPLAYVHNGFELVWDSGVHPKQPA